MQALRCDAIIIRDVNIRSTFQASGVGVQHTSQWQNRSKTNFASSRTVPYFVDTNMKIELLAYILYVVPRVCDFRDGRYSGLKRTYSAVTSDCYWTPATFSGKTSVFNTASECKL